MTLDCNKNTIVFSFCRADCVEVNESPFFDIYVGPYQPATPQLPIIPKNETLSDVSGSNESDKLVNNTEKNDTKTEMPKQVISHSLYQKVKTGLRQKKKIQVRSYLKTKSKNLRRI